MNNKTWAKVRNEPVIMERGVMEQTNVIFTVVTAQSK